MPNKVFDRNLYRQNRNRAAHSNKKCDFLFNEIVDIVFEKLSILLNNGDKILNLGCRSGQLINLLQQNNRNFKKEVFQCDISYSTVNEIKYGKRVVLDEEFLPFAEKTFNVVINAMSLHCVNNLPNVLLQINNILKKDGIFIGTLFGLKTLNELRQSILNVELKSGAVESRIIPFINARDAINLLQQSRFLNSIIDIYTIIAEYKNIYDLFYDLRGMGETNMLYSRNKNSLSIGLIAEIEKFYIDNFSQDGNYIPATFEIIIMQGIKST